MRRAMPRQEMTDMMLRCFFLNHSLFTNARALMRLMRVDIFDFYEVFATRDQRADTRALIMRSYAGCALLIA